MPILREKIFKKILEISGKTNKLNLKFNPREWKEINDFLEEWDEWRRKEGPMDRPDFTSDAIYLLPLAIALMKAQKQSERMTKILIFLTLITSLLIIIQIIILLR